METYLFICRSKTALLFSCLKGVCVNSNVNEKKTLRIKLVVREVIDKMFIV